MPLLEKAYDNWRELEEVTGERLFYDCGLLYAGARDGELSKGVKRAAEMYSVNIEILTRREAKTRYPQFNIPEQFDVIFEENAGFVLVRQEGNTCTFILVLFLLLSVGKILPDDECRDINALCFGIIPVFPP